jgi:secondary thiamine-phosphate synthase enzyme
MPGRGARDISSAVQSVVAEAGAESGLCQVFIHHTSASLMLCENADPAVLVDLETIMARLAPDGDPGFVHTAEGPDDMPAHVRSILTQTSLTIPVARGQCDLGTWQGIFLWEHRTAPHRRRLTVSVLA